MSKPRKYTIFQYCNAMVSSIANPYATKGFDSAIILKHNVKSDKAKRKIDRQTETWLIEPTYSLDLEGYAY